MLFEEHFSGHDVIAPSYRAFEVIVSLAKMLVHVRQVKVLAALDAWLQARMHGIVVLIVHSRWLKEPASPAFDISVCGSKVVRKMILVDLDLAVLTLLTWVIVPEVLGLPLRIFGSPLAQLARSDKVDAFHMFHECCSVTPAT